MARFVRCSGENVNIFRRVATPDASNDISLGDLWSDLSLSPPILKKLVSLSPVTWTSTEGSGGGGAGGGGGGTTVGASTAGSAGGPGGSHGGGGGGGGVGMNPGLGGAGGLGGVGAIYVITT